MKATRTRHGWVHIFITHRPTLTLHLHNFGLFRTCRTSSFCTVAWQLARFQLTRRIARSLGDSWASCLFKAAGRSIVFANMHHHLMRGFSDPHESVPKRHLARFTRFCGAHVAANRHDTHTTLQGAPKSGATDS